MMLYLRLAPEGEIKSIDLRYQTCSCEALNAFSNCELAAVCEESA